MTRIPSLLSGAGLLLMGPFSLGQAPSGADIGGLTAALGSITGLKSGARVALGMTDANHHLIGAQPGLRKPAPAQS